MSEPARFDRLSSRALVLDLSDVDTDQIVPARFLKRPREQGFGEVLFYNLRRHPDGSMRDDFPLNHPSAAGAQLLVAGANFGCGSSREGAVYALTDAGLRVILAPSFGDIFSNNALKNGLLPIVLAPQAIEDLKSRIRRTPSMPVSVDLERQRVEYADVVHEFEIDPFARDALLNGVDEIGLTLLHEDAIRRFEEADAQRRPWL